MTEPERAALDHIRRVVDSVIGELASPEIPSSGPAEIRFLPVPYISQFEEGEGKMVTDSGAAAGAMMVRAYTKKQFTPTDFFNQVKQPADNRLSLTQISNVLRTNGIAAAMRTGLKLSDLSLTLVSGRPVILPVKLTVLQQAGLTPESFEGLHYLVGVGLDVKKVYIHDPLRRDASGEAQGIPWLTFYQAWTQALGSERAALVPRIQLLRRVKVTAATLNVRRQPDDETSLAGTVSAGDVFEISTQLDGWGKIGEDRWISLSYVADI
jgi:hypothetical protein